MRGANRKGIRKKIKRKRSEKEKTEKIPQSTNNKNKENNK